MKNRHLLAIVTIIAFSTNHLFATDRVVQQGGPVGTYTSISSAITAAVDGDNIVINNRIDGLPWLESISINKSLTFVSAVDNIQWWMEGNVSITMAESRVVTIIGMKNTNGSFSKTGTVPINRTIVNVLYSDVVGNITMGNGINLYLGSSKTQQVDFTYGKLYGNDLRSIYLTSDGVSTEDVVQIIGNRIGYSYTPFGMACYIATNTQYVYLANNYIRSSNGDGLYISTLKSGATTNRILNCALVSSYASAITNNQAGLQLLQASGALTVENCVMAGFYNNSTNGAHAIRATSGAQAVTTFTYNMYYNYYAGGFSPSSSLANFSNGSAIQSNFTADGALNTGTGHINAGNPLNDYLDLDLSRNDIGVYGGSYSMANFTPLVFNGESSRTNWMSTPRVVNQGGTVNVQVLGYDK